MTRGCDRSPALANVLSCADKPPAAPVKSLVFAETKELSNKGGLSTVVAPKREPRAEGAAGGEHGHAGIELREGKAARPRGRRVLRTYGR